MLVTKKEHGVERVNGERIGLDNIGLFFDAFGGFRGRFPFLASSAHFKSDYLRRIQPKGDSPA
jgi:hypothetical protein